MMIRKLINLKPRLTNQQGSLTLEAVIVFPVFLVIMLALINFMKICMVYVAMDHAVSETTKQVATHVYPLKYLQVATVDQTQKDVLKVIENLAPLNGNSMDKIKQAAKSDLVYLLGGQYIQDTTGKIVSEAIEAVVRKSIKDTYPLGNLNQDDYRIVQATIYNPNKPEGNNGKLGNLTLNNEDIALVVEYKVKLPIPFIFLNEITLSNTSVERAWIEPK